MTENKKKMSNKKFLAILVPILGVIFVILIVATILVAGPFYGIITTFFEGDEKVERGDGKVYYESTTASHDAAIAESKKLITDIQSEGTVLLKNDGCLPIASGSKLTLFGRDSVDILYSGGGSGGLSSKAKPMTLKQALESDGFSVNPIMWNVLDGAKSKYPRGKEGVNNLQIVGEIAKSDYDTPEVKASFDTYSDYAVVVIGRSGAEGVDLPQNMRDWGGESDKHFLELCNAEKDMVEYACAHFDKVIALINCSATLELGWLNEYGGKIKAALYIGYPGETGLEALGDMLKGDTVPSGHTVDTFAYDLTQAPSYVNMAYSGHDFKYADVNNGYYIEYEEGIYVGYRYYETRGKTDGEKWYTSQVQYPFGYGLSYASFEYEYAETPVYSEEEQTFTFKVKVTNTDKKHAGKGVAQIYVNAPWQEGQTEKSHVVLVGFAKTGLLEADGGNETVTINVSKDYIMSYDYIAEKAYVLDVGDYNFYLGDDENGAHSWATIDGLDEGAKSKRVWTYNIGSKIVCAADGAGKRVTDMKIATNEFDDVSKHVNRYLSRGDWVGTFPTAPDDNAVLGDANKSKLDAFVYDTYKTASGPTTEEVNDVWLVDMVGKSYNDEDWERLLNRVSVDEMVKLVSQAGYKTQKMDSIGKPPTTDADGPAGFSSFFSSSVYGAGFTSEVVLASAWSEELAEKMGRCVGEEGLQGGYSGWYAPGVNIHRSPFGGRNFEYYSEDGLLSGKIAAAVVKGCSEKGVFCYVKHFAVNDSETRRSDFGLITWVNEQAMRELYFKPFELAVKEGKTTAIMSSFNRLGTVWAGGCRPLLTNVLREEWGFVGAVVTDYDAGAYMDADQMLSAGGDMMMNTIGKKPSDRSSNAALAAMRAATKNVLYTVAGSNAMNGMTRAAAKIIMPTWYKLFIAVDVVCFVALAVGVTFTVLRVYKNRKSND